LPSRSGYLFLNTNKPRTFVVRFPGVSKRPCGKPSVLEMESHVATIPIRFHPRVKAQRRSTSTFHERIDLQVEGRLPGCRPSLPGAPRVDNPWLGPVLRDAGSRPSPWAVQTRTVAPQRPYNTVHLSRHSHTHTYMYIYIYISKHTHTHKQSTAP
jgi:hypothetical protein